MERAHGGWKVHRERISGGPRAYLENGERMFKVVKTSGGWRVHVLTGHQMWRLMCRVESKCEVLMSTLGSRCEKQIYKVERAS